MSDPRDIIADALWRIDGIHVTPDGPDDEHRANADAIIAKLRAAGILVQPGGETRTWSLPAEPGQEVKAVCTSRGEIWRRGTGYFAQLWTRERLAVVGGGGSTPEHG